MSIEVEENLNSEIILNEIIQYIALNYLSSFYLFCVVTSNTTKFIPNLENFHSFNFQYNQSENSKKVYQKGIDCGCQAFIISEDVFEKFLEDFYELHDISIQVFPEKHVLVYSELSEIDKKPLKNPAIDDLPHILFINLDLNSMKVKFSTTKFTGNNKESSSIYLITEIKINDGQEISSKLNGINLYPQKVHNLDGREIVLAIFNYLPYTIWKEVNDSNDEKVNSYEALQRTPLHIDGTETWVFLEFCKRINCSLLISLDEAGEWGEIFDNRTGNGIIGAVVERRAEVGVGALYSWYHESIFLSLSKFISRTGVTCITPKPRLRDPLGTPLLPFSLQLWIAVLISFIVGIISYKFLQKAESLIYQNSPNQTMTEISLNIIGIYVLQSVTLSMKSIGMFIFFMTVLILGLLLGNSYSSSLASVLTIPQYEKAIDTVEELAASGMEWGSTHDAWIFSILLATQPMILQLLSKFKTLSKENLEQRAIKKDLSFSIERLPYGHYAIGEYITEDTVYHYQTLTNDIYYELCVAMSTKTWPLMSQLDELILQIFESGIQKFVELDVVVKNSNNKIQLAVERSRHLETPGPTKLTPLHISGAFILLATGLCLSTLSFFIEIIYHRKNHGKVIRTRLNEA
ncbi:hypothetical protein PVAND_006356 [Polypedilum vanderplanki]|uniref:Ionotropic glutamate receptor C-terminal domain-containing protein n=1 Tax=Polypedilum vanderplanki TaxID=319348 RepID=A0A9J6C3T7_POLVA|nr:hypothetical protein PVAND_006356 [Polypedilum vanderplanki]